MKINVGVLFGSKSVEHEVSIISANQVINAMDKAKYNVIPIYITKSGEWLTGDELFDLNTYKNLPLDINKFHNVLLTSNKKENLIIRKKGLFGKDTSLKLDVLFPVLHGAHGEDGTIQGYFEIIGIPYVGSSVVGSAVGMDKIIMKAVFHENGLPVSPYVWFTKSQWLKDQNKIIADIKGQLNYPLFIKPANLGSSIGISRAVDENSLIECIELAVMYDRRILVEEEVNDSIEINCSVLGREEPMASVCEQPLKWNEYLTFEEKYMSGGKGKSSGLYTGKESTQRKIPAPISKEMTDKIQKYSVEAFKAVDASGVSRIDWLLKKDESQFYINEINTIPGSLSFYLWESTGIPFQPLIDKLINLAFEVAKEKESRIYTYDSNILKAERKSGKK